MKVTKTSLQDALIVEPGVFGDNRGWFTESYSEKVFAEAGLNFNFIQDNHSFSAQAGVLRGLHFQLGEAAQTKLVRVVTGVVYDLIVDLRKGSPTYGQHEGFILSEANHRQLLVPKGFAHGFCNLTDNVNFMYKCDNYYAPGAEGGILFSDPALKINWPFDLANAITSEKDTKYPTFAEFAENNPFVYGEI